MGVDGVVVCTGNRRSGAACCCASLQDVQWTSRTLLTFCPRCGEPACRPLTQRVLGAQVLPGQAQTQQSEQAQQVPASAAAAHQQQLQPSQQQQPAAMGSWAASAVQQHAAPPAPGGIQQQQQQHDSEGQQHPLTMPVSAVAAGWAPDRSGAAPTGSGELEVDRLGLPLSCCCGAGCCPAWLSVAAAPAPDPVSAHLLPLQNCYWMPWRKS